MFDRLGSFVARRWTLVLGIWVVAIAAIHTVAPRWNEVTRDGDFAYLPKEMTSVRGSQLLATGFPDYYSKSQIALVIAREDGKLTAADYEVAAELLKRFPAPLEEEEVSEEGKSSSNTPSVTAPSPAPEKANSDAEPKAQEAPAAKGKSSEKPSEPTTKEPVPPVTDSPVSAVWSYDTPVIGRRLVTPVSPEHGQAAMIVLHLGSEFMAIENMKFLRSIYDTLDEIRSRPDFPKGLKLGVTGSAAVGADMLFAAEESIRNTEWTTIGLVVLILLLVYRAPGLVIVPLATIGVSVILSMDLVAMAAYWADQWGIDFKIFKTTRIFIVVILFGAGTDYCLFLIARYREELQRGLPAREAIGEALGRVGNALAASALTTVLGLGMLFFADFGKFSSSGPTIGLCLLVTLTASLTLTPAVLCAVGPIVFWPFKPSAKKETTSPDTLSDHAIPQGRFFLSPERFWDALSRLVTQRPGLVLIVAVLLMSPLIHPVRTGIAKIFGQDPAALRIDVSGSTPQKTPGQQELTVERSWTVPVSYDMLKELSPSSPSVQGTKLLRSYFSADQTDPIIIVAFQKGVDFADKKGRRKVALLTKELFEFVYTDRDGKKLRPVVGVRSLTEPLGDEPGGFNPLSAKGRQKIVSLHHPGTHGAFVSTASPLAGQLTRFDVITAYPPFSVDNLRLLDQIEESLQKKTLDKTSDWHDAVFHYAGNTAGIRDLQTVTTGDNLRIQLLVVIAVLIVLLIILQRPWICLYLIVSVLFGYYVTIGATELLFRWYEGPAFTGLDWKVPIFLFVILVAVGEDYNIYLTTRVLEEQRRFGPLEGLRIALLKTGGIITSCGVIMAGTFASMATGTLSMMQQLGFALALGVLLDTFVIRTILVPAFLALGVTKSPEKENTGTESA